MKKSFRNTLLVLGILASLAALGCGGDEKKPADKPAEKPKQEVNIGKNAGKEDKKDNVVEIKVKPVPKSPLYVYALHLDDEKKIPPMTDEVIKEFEAQAKDVKFAEKNPAKGCKGIWTFNSARTPGAQIHTYRWTAEMPGHHDSTFENDKGKKINEQHFCHIDMTVDAKTNKLLNVRKVIYDVTKETGEKGKLTELVNKKIEN